MVLKKVIEKILPPKTIGRIQFYTRPQLRASWGGPFNGQKVRTQIFRSIIEICAPIAIVETGTYRGTTARFMALSTTIPVFTVEYDATHFGFSSEHLRGVKNVRLYQGDSRSFLRTLLESQQLQSGPILFYLDAHWDQDLPLAEEIEIIFSAQPHSIVIIDDFQVPWDSGYIYDDYGSGKALNSDYLAGACRSFKLLRFFPSISSKIETGAKRGCVVLVSYPAIVAKLAGINSLRCADSL